MKTKRRTVNDTKVCNKKIMTRNMQHKIIEDKIQSTTTNCHNHLLKKSSSKTRGKTTSSTNKDSDPYSFSKMDEECKIPIKKIKLAEKISKDVAVNTSTFSTMTDPELLGPCEPGTSIELQGIVWMETSTGLLVINVTWRGRSYVGTLLDSTKYQFTPSFNFHDFTQKFETRHTSRPNRGKKTFIPPGNNCHTGSRSNNIRHSRRLCESLSYSNNIKKSSARLANNSLCYIDTLSLSADVSLSGESDTDLNPYQKYSPTNKTRSVTRSLAKQNNVFFSEELSSEMDNSNNFLKCSQQNCFKKFTDQTALRYHLQLIHQIFEEEVKVENNVIDQSIISKDTPLKEKTTSYNNDPTLPNISQINGKIKRDNVNFEFNSDSELDKVDEKLNQIKIERYNGKKDEYVTADKVLGWPENIQKKMSDSPNNLPHVTESVVDNPSQIDLVKIPVIEEKDRQSNQPALTIKNYSPKQAISHNLKVTSQPNTEVTTHSNPVVRTVTAPTVSIPFETSTTITSSDILQPPCISQALSKSSQVTLNSSYNSQSRKLKSSKVHNTSSINSFQIPSATTLSKKRPLVPLKVSVTSTMLPSQSRVIQSSPNLNAVSSSNTSRHIRSSTYSNVTPILPAISSSNAVTSVISSSNVSSGLCSMTSSFLNNSINTKRPICTSNNVSPSGITSLLSLKPIQPKPKSTSNPLITSNSISSSLITSVSTSTLPGLLTTQTTYQRQILPSPVSKSENGNNSDDKLILKVDSIKTTSMKKKRRKPDKKLKVNFHECNRLKPFPLNPIQPKRKKECENFLLKQNDITLSADNYKMDEENSHSPEYSDLSETNDTPAPILEKEVELKSGDCDKLIICTDFEPTSTHRIRSSCSDNSPYNKPPALMPAVLSTDLLNGSSNDIDLSDTPVKVGRRKLQPMKKPTISNELSKDLLQCCNELDFPTTLRHNNTITSSRKSFQSSSFEEQHSPLLFASSKMPLYNSLQNDFHDLDQNYKLKPSNKSLNLSAINDYVWMTKNNQDLKTKNCGKMEDNSYSTKVSTDSDSNKKRFPATHSQQSNGRFSVQALTSPQEIVSRSLTTSSTVIAVNPNAKSTNTLFKN